MKKIFIILIIVRSLSFFPVEAQISNIPNSQIGVTEHLGDTIPLDLKFANENGDSVTLRQLINKPTVMSFVYYDCPGVCSPLLKGVSDVIEQSDMKLGKDYQVITVSFNFRDTPEKAKKKKLTFMSRYVKQTSKDWIYLTTDSATIYKIINSVGYNIRQEGMFFSHPSAIVMVSPKGKITRYLYGLRFLPFDLKMAVVEAEKGLPRPTVHKVLQFCFSYDPQGRRYAIEVTKISASIIIFLILIFVTTLFVKSKKKY